MIQPKNLAVACALIGLLTTSGIANAEGMYGSLQGGQSSIVSSSLDGQRDDIGTATDGIKLDDSIIIAGAVGYRTKASWRVEAEVTYQKFDVNEIKNIAGTFVSATGDVKAIGVGLNGVYEFRISNSSMTPYFGAGAGAVFVEGRDIQVPGRSTGNEEAIAPRGQILMGVDFDLNKLVALTAGYRLQGIGVIDGSHTKTNGQSFNGESSSVILIHGVTAGLRFNF